jgi:hypothetical protein
VSVQHNHVTRDIKMDGSCPPCAEYLAADDQRSGGTIMNDKTGYAQDRAGNLAPGKDPRPYTAQQAFAVLKALGYGAGQADLAMSRALANGSWPLSRHVLRYDSEAGTYAVTARRAQ